MYVSQKNLKHTRASELHIENGLLDPHGALHYALSLLDQIPAIIQMEACE